MLFTLSEIVIETRLLQPLKADAPMLVTLSGITNDTKPVQPSKADAARLDSCTRMAGVV